MRLAKFIEKLDKNEIEDLTPYIEKGNLKELIEIATRGLEIDLLLKRGELDVIKTLIQYNHATEYYHMWKQHSDKSIRQALATEALSKIPTPLEKTLSVTQLFTMQNPLWTIGLSANTINDILYTHDRAKKLGWNDQFDNLLDIICANNYQNVRLTCYEYEYKLNKQTN